MPVWQQRYPGVESMNVAVMGCIVNGPGESKHADIGISLPGTGESPTAPVFVDGRKAHTLRGERIAEEFQAIVADYVERRYGRPPSTPERRSSGRPIMSQLRPARGTHDLLGEELRRHRHVADTGARGRAPLRLRRDRDADLRVHRGVPAHAGRDLGHRHQGDVHLRGSRRRPDHAAAGEHRRRGAGRDQRRADPGAAAAVLLRTARCSATSGRRRAGCASSTRSASS